MSVSYLSQFQNIRPRYQIPQTEMLQWLARAHALAEVAQDQTRSLAVEFERMHKIFSRVGCKPDRIASRGMDIEDAITTDLSRAQLYRITAETPSGLGIKERTTYFAENAYRVVKQFYPEGCAQPEHIVHVTCTGYISPSAVQRIVVDRAWNANTALTHAYHMGCYAAFPAIRQAIGFVASRPQALSPNIALGSVDVLHTEMCSLHMNPLDHRPEQMVVQSLFADGYIKYSVSDQREAQCLELMGPIRELIIPESFNHMSWQPAEWGMSMTLDKDVPRVVAEHLKGFLTALYLSTGTSAGTSTGVDAASMQEKATFAIHPGGPRIIDSIQELLQLSETQVAHSKGVLRDFGNMSSATLPHIWQRILQDESVPNGQPIVSLAFGPGLTIFGAVLRKHV